MKRSLLSLILTLAAAMGASAQSGWGSSDGWDAPKKSTPKKTTTKAATSGGQTRATGNEKTPQNDGRTVSPYPSAPAQADPNPGNTASTPPDNSFVPGTTSSSTQGGNDRQGMSVAPGTPVMLQSGRNVLANDAAAARERRMNRMNKLNKVPATPTLVGAEGTTEAAGAAAPAAAPATSPAMGAAGTTGTGSKAGSMNGGAAAPAASKTTTTTKSTRTTTKPVKKAAPANDGW